MFFFTYVFSFMGLFQANYLGVWMHLNLTSSSKRFPPPLPTMREVDFDIALSSLFRLSRRVDAPRIFYGGEEQGWWYGKSTLLFSNLNISKKPSNVDKIHVIKSVSLTFHFIGRKKPTWQKRQGSWPALDCCTPDSLRSSAGTWQTTFWCKKSTINLLLYCTWQLLFYLAAATILGGSCKCDWSFILQMHCARQVLLLNKAAPF